MPISQTRAQAHIGEWRAKLSKSDYPHRHGWPPFLFHHAPLENAVRILQECQLRSRNDPARESPLDVAEQRVLQTRSESHDFVRFYFRPRNPTQYWIEGIRRPEDRNKDFGANAHAPILVMFCFDAVTLLSRSGTAFSDMNMQRRSAKFGDNEEFFGSILFDKVYHEGSFKKGEAITSYRCAEVLAQSPVLLPGVLKRLVFRSAPERDTLLRKLGSDGERWRELCGISQAMNTFEKNFPFVQSVWLNENGLYFTLNPRKDSKTIHLKVSVKDQRGSRFSNIARMIFSLIRGMEGLGGAASITKGKSPPGDI